MRALSASDLLDLWERGTGQTPVVQALAILRAAFPKAPEDVLAGLDISQRDLCLLHLRSLTFGSQIEGLADCPACGQRLEFDFDVRKLPGWRSPLPDPASIKSLTPEGSFRLNDYKVTFRLPNSVDLLAISSVTDVASSRQQLIEGCIISAQRDGKTLAAGELPAEALDAMVEWISQENPLADLTLPVTCPACSHTWVIVFDIVSYFWSEIQAWSIRLMQEVHTLAMTYGWPEAEILGMSSWRRQRYLEMIGVR